MPAASKLGTSLENLLARRKPAKPEPAAGTAVPQGDALNIPVDAITPNPSQPRSDFGEEAFQELVQSIRQNGIIQAVIVRRAGDGFELVAGERRWRAAKAAGLSTVPAQVRNVDSAKAFELSIIENIQREDLNPIERARAYKRMIETGRDLHELHALMAPRPFLVSGGSEDRAERWRALNHAVAVNRFLGYENRVAMTNRQYHTPTPASNEQMYLFLEYFLKHKPMAHQGR